MTYYTIPPPEHLSDIIRFFWVLESPASYTHYSMADVCPELLFHYKGRFEELFDNATKQKSFSAGIHGQTGLTRKFHVNEGFGILGVYFYPQAIPLIFGMPASELTNQMTCLNTLLKGEGDSLEDRIANAPDNHQRMQIITDFIKNKLERSYTQQLPIFHSIQAIIQNKGLIKVKQLSAKYFLSERQFERRFRQFAGFGPKIFSRIVRFQSTVAQYGRVQKSLTEIALESGYYDQSHFIHDFKEFSGYHPRHYFSGESGATDWRI